MYATGIVIWDGLSEILISIDSLGATDLPQFLLLTHIALFLQLLYEHCGRSPSLRVAVAVVCALRALRLPPRTARVAYYAGVADVQVLPSLAATVDS